MDGKQILNIRNSKVEDYIVAGNHDYHILKSHDSSYQVKFYLKSPDSFSPSAVKLNTNGPLLYHLAYMFKLYRKSFSIF
jgi:hypothetical protein